MLNDQEIAAKIAKALDTGAQCSTTETPENYSLLRGQLDELETSAGQSLRSHVACKSLIAKLERGTPLTGDEMTTLRSMIVGDADEYLKYNDDFEDAKQELAKVLDEIRRLKTDDAGPQTLMKLRVLCHEASSALGPTVHYLEQKERVRNFEEHTRDPLSNDARHVLVRVIEDMAV